MSHPSSAGAPIGLPPGNNPPGSVAPGGGSPHANGGYSLPAGAAGHGPVSPGRGAPDTSPLFGPPDPDMGSVFVSPEPPASRTYRDLPADPPYGPIQPYRDPLPPRRSSGQDEVPGEVSRITPLQIALGVGGILLLLAVGIGAALLFLSDDNGQDAASAPAPVATDQEGDPFGQFTPSPAQPDPGPTTQPDTPQAELTPVPAPSTPADPAPQFTPAPDGGAPTPDGTDPGAAAPGASPPGEPGTDTPSDGATAPEDGTAPAPQAPDGPAPDPQAGTVELPLLFELSQLPRDTSEADTTVTQTSGADDTDSLEQVTRLEHSEGEIIVRAVRADDASDRFAALQTETSREVTVRGQPAFVLEGQRLIWLVPGGPDTFLEVDAPATVGTDELLTIANGLELN